MMEKKSTSMILEANFDIDQVGSTLEYHFWRRDKQGNPIEGKDAGSIYFTVGEKFYIQVKAGSKKPFRSFDILDCCIISAPQIYQCGPEIATVYAPPSPFAAEMPGEVRGASINLPAKQFEPRMVAPKDGYYQIVQNWTDHLTVAGLAARWEISFIITVRVTPQDGDSYLRVFSFDPEAVVGTSSSPDGFELEPNMLMMMPEPVVGTAGSPD